MEGSKPGIIIVGNAGSGKSYICNMLIGYDRFKANFQPEAVTTATEHHSITLGGKPFEVYNIPGLIEVNQECIDRNKREIIKAFDQSPTSIVMFVLSHVGGRAQSDDVIAFKALNNAYKFPPESLMFVVNNIPPKRPSEYEGQFLTTLANLLKPMKVSTQDMFFIDALNSEDKEKIKETCSRLYLFINQHHASLQRKHADIILQSDQLEEMRKVLKKQQLEAEKDRVAFEKQLAEMIKEYEHVKKDADEKYKKLLEKFLAAEKNAGKDRKKMQEELHAVRKQADNDRQEYKKMQEELDAVRKQADNDRQEYKKALEKREERHLNCKGRACSTCNGCRDWHRVDSHWALVDGGTCNASRYLIYLHMPDLCHCKDYY